MPRNTKVVSISAPPKELRKIDRAAARAGLSRSEFYNMGAANLAAEITGESRLADLQALAAAGLSREASKRPRRPVNSTAIIAAASSDGHQRLAGLQAIVDANGAEDA